MRAEENSELSKAHSDMQELNMGEEAHGRVRQLPAQLKDKGKHTESRSQDRLPRRNIETFLEFARVKLGRPKLSQAGRHRGHIGQQ